MSDLIAFLRARLDEDEAAAAAATAAVEDSGWDPFGPLAEIAVPPATTFRRHIARWGPDRALRHQVPAMRAIVVLHAAEPGQHPDFCWHDKHELPCPTLRVFASFYAGHPDYREEWKP